MSPSPKMSTDRAVVIRGSYRGTQTWAGFLILSNMSLEKNHRGCVLKIRIPGPTPKQPDPVGLGP